MRPLRSLYFDALEERKLLSRAPVVASHAKPHVAATPLVLSGSLTLDNNAATMNTDEMGDVMTSTPVAGQLGALGEVHGVWNETTDEYGDYMGPDTIQLHTANGTFVVQFSEQKTDAVHHLAGGAVEYVRPQLASDGTGAYARERERGTIDMTTNAARTAIVSISLGS